MSDDKISLEFLGEQMRRMQTDVRDVRNEQGSQKGDIQGLGAKIGALDAKIDHVESKLEDKIDRVDRRLDNFAASVDARFDQANQTAATNLAVTVTAIQELGASTNEQLERVEKNAAENLETVLKAIDTKLG